MYVIFLLRNGEKSMNYLTEYQAGDNQILIDPLRILGHLVQVMKSKGQNQRDISEMNGWPFSRTNRLIKGNQQIHARDCRIAARSLGSVIRSVLRVKDDDELNVDISRDVEFFGFLLPKLLSHSEEVSIIAEYELPVSIINLLGVESTDYIITAKVVNQRKAGKGKTELKDDGIFIMFERRHMSNKDCHVKFGVIVSPDREDIVFGAWVVPNKCDEESDVKRQLYKQKLSIVEVDSIQYEILAKQGKKWLPEEYRRSEIASSVYSKEKILDTKEFIASFSSIYFEFCRLVNEVEGTNIEEVRSFRNMIDSVSGVVRFDDYTFNCIKELSTFPICETITNDVLDTNNRLCEIDDSHESFTGADNKKYMEVVPLVPIVPKTMSKYGGKLQLLANGVCLCPICYSKLEHGTKDEREDMICELYRKHRDVLRENNFDISLSELLDLYDLVQE